MFQTAEFAILTLISFSCVWLLKGRRRPRTALLLIASYAFFANCNLAHPVRALHPEIYTAFNTVLITLGLLFTTSTIDFFIGTKLDDTEDPRARKRLVTTSIVVNLALLAGFKYFDFLAAELGALFNFKHDSGFRLLFPIGISFYTFQSLSYTIDVYRKRSRATQRYLTYLLYLAFFPQAIMGPIVRAHDLIPQLEARPHLDADAGAEAFLRIGIGIVKKLAIADFLRLQIVDPVFSNPEMYSTVETLTAVYAYTFQIWADFSGYTDIAIGVAALLGITLPENFNAPYRSRSVREFWQRWHITLSTWLRDYLYIPLGGSRTSKPRTYLNLMITMVLGGMWHGPSTTFLVWGAIHGMALVANHIIRKKHPRPILPGAANGVLLQLITFHVVAAAWIFFRAPSFAAAGTVFENMSSFDMGVQNISIGVLTVLAFAATCHFAPHRLYLGVVERFKRLPAPVQAALLVAAIYLAKLTASTQVSPFIYAQF